MRGRVSRERPPRTTKPGLRDDLRDTARDLASAASRFPGAFPMTAESARNTTRKTAVSPEQTRSASIGATGWRRGQSRANPSRDDFGQMPADCCTHACDARATMTSWGPSGWLPDLRPAMRIDEGHHHFGRRSSSAWAKNAEAFRKISLARRSSRTYGVRADLRAGADCSVDLLRSRRRAWSTRRGQG